MPIDDVRIGDFSQRMSAAAPSAAAESIVIDNPALSGRTAEALSAKERMLSVEASKDEAALQPMAEYEKRLAELKIPKEKAAEIIDAVLAQGSYSETYQITRKVGVTFRTRGRRDVKRAQDMIEAQRLSYEHHYGDTLATYLMAASLTRFGNDVLQHPARTATVDEVEASYKIRLNYVDALGEPAFNILRAKLIKFDQMIGAVLQEGAIENF